MNLRNYKADHLVDESVAGPLAVSVPAASGFLRRRARAPLSVRRGQRGVGLVEFALVVMVFMTMVLGVIDFSRALYTYHFLSNAARQATRWAAVNGMNCDKDTSTTDSGGSCNGTYGMNNGPASATDVENYVANHVPMGIDASKLSTTVTWPVGTDSPVFCDSSSAYYQGANYPGCTVEVQITYPFSFLYPFVHSGTITMSSSSEMVIAH